MLTFSGVVVERLLMKQLVSRLPHSLQRLHAHAKLLKQCCIIAHLFAQLVGVCSYWFGTLHLTDNSKAIAAKLLLVQNYFSEKTKDHDECEIESSTSLLPSLC